MHGSIALRQDDRHLIAGHATLGMEILEQLPEVDIILVGCGGGGLAAATGTVMKEFNSQKQIKVYAVEPENANSMYLSVKVISSFKFCPFLAVNIV